MKTDRRNFIRIAAASGTAMITSGFTTRDFIENGFSILSPVDGDMLTESDGTLVNGALVIPVRILAPAGSKIIINNLTPRFSDNMFSADVPIKDYKNIIEVTRPDTGQRQSLTIYWLKNLTNKYRLSLDDNIWFLKDISINSNKYKSIFENPYLGFLKKVHDTYGTKIHINIYYQTEGFNLSQMTQKYKPEWKDNASWLRLSFHALQNDPDRPYQDAGYDQVKKDCEMVKDQIKRFAGEELMGPVTTLHWGAAKVEGCRALRDAGYKALAGYFVVEKDQEPVSYYLDQDKKLNLSKRVAWKDHKEGIIFSRINIVINSHKLEEIVPYLDEIKKDPHRSAYMDVMIHEQYFYPTYTAYQPDYRQKVMTTVKWAAEKGYKPAFLSECLFS
jgi:hypothetical protein